VNISQVREDLERLDQSIREAERNKSRFLGQKEQVEKDLKDTHGIRSTEMGTTRVKEIDEEVGELTEEVIKDYTDLKEAHPW